MRNARRVLILNSYTLTQRCAEEQVRVRYFIAGLAQSGYRRGENLEIEILDSNDLEELEAQLCLALADPPDLIHAVGTPNAIVAAKWAGEIPIVYYGAHPEQVGTAECSGENLCGVTLTLPFTSDYKRYRFVRRFLPRVRRIYVPFYEGTVFCPPAMAEKHRRFRRAAIGSPWVPMDSELVGYRSLAGLNYIVGLDYRELVYRDAEDLRAALAAVEPEGALLMPYNDSVYCRDAPGLLCRFAIEARLPLIWNNNPEATRIGALAAIAGCFKEAGLVCGGQAAQILDTGNIVDVEPRTSTKSYASLHLGRVDELGLDLDDEVFSYFDELIPAGVAVT